MTATMTEAKPRATMTATTLTADAYAGCLYKLEELWSLAPNAVFGESYCPTPKTERPVRFYANYASGMYDRPIAFTYCER